MAHSMSQLLGALRACLGAENVLVGPGLTPYATDVFRPGVLPLAMLSPGSVEALCQAMTLLHRAGVAVVPRGGGASYTGGYLPRQADAVLLDLRGLQRVVEINEADAYVTVEAGLTWQALDAALAPLGWRTPFRGPFSGSVATVGGALAQHAISHGTGAHGLSADSVLGLDVVLADGQLLRTGSAALAGHGAFFRHHGPDLTGLFLGDCGAFGVKARVTLPLRRRCEDVVALSFAFDTFAALHAGMRAAAREGVDDTHFALDAAMLRGSLARPRGLAASLAIARGVWASAPHGVAGAARLLRLAWAGDRALRQPAFLAHYLVEGGSPAEARARAARLRRAVLRQGRAIANTVPTVLRAQPFDRLFHVLGPQGERWVPVHGILPHSQVAAFDAAFAALCHARAAQWQAWGLWWGRLFECIGPGAFSYEICLYWRDGLNDYHRHHASASAQARAQPGPEDLARREAIAALREDLVALFQAHGAVHMQLGRTYPYAEALTAPSAALAQALKQAVDPAGRMNPGVLGLAAPL